MQFDVEPMSHDGGNPRERSLEHGRGPGFRDVMTHLVRQGGPHIVVDLGDTDFIDSTGLGAMVSGLKTARAAGGDLRIARAGTQVMMVLQLTKLDQILHSYDTVEECFELAMPTTSPTAA